MASVSLVLGSKYVIRGVLVPSTPCLVYWGTSVWYSGLIVAKQLNRS